ncbi:prenyltransferase/squalene oxidase repeat-containing protein [Actinomadura welshii]|uniref:prenyltransferase/squalene oxidase repeat-containing protein n=1 Tax=Actinomadura welshii TaxID=3103817 RepID=UPI0003AD11DA|nr:prenyltransferase/squalene oxidase repeat-containing protein [Actinomadura madurae]
MTLDATPDCAGLVDIIVSAQKIVDDLTERPWGSSSPSVYETGRLVSLAPWLTGHGERLRFLLAEQRPDGGWGLPDDGYALVPTLSATEALLSALGADPFRMGPTGIPVADVARAAARGLGLLSRWLAPGRVLDLPDMPAIEHIVPHLLERINARLDERAMRRIPGLGPWTAPDHRLRAPGGMAGELLPVVRELLERGDPIPAKLLHALEIAGESAHGTGSVVPGPSGTVGASPAATAAWLGHEPDPHDDARARARRYLEAGVAQYKGPVPVATPITEFERGWVLSWLARAGVPVKAPPRLTAELRAALGSAGTGGGEGLPPDADTTSGVLYALSLLGSPCAPDLLSQYEMDTHFCTWQGENGRSVTTNAHVLEAFGHFLETTGGGTAAHRYSASMFKITSWLCERQEADGSWRDRWHASPYYATCCAVLALERYGSGAGRAGSVDRAVRWVLGSQRTDGGWGRWDGTIEETAYAVHILLLAGSVREPLRDDCLRAASRGGAFIRSALTAGSTADAADAPQTIGQMPSNSNNPPLWHDKDTYLPATIVSAVTFAALALLQEYRRGSLV